MCIFIKEFISPTAGDWLSKVLVTCKVQDEFNNFKIDLHDGGEIYLSPWFNYLGGFCVYFLVGIKTV